MKKHLLILFAALLSLAASAQTKVEIDGIWYNLITKGKAAEVTSKSSGEYSGSITIPATVTYEGVDYSVTSIGSDAFANCSSLTSITIPEGVTSIGEDAFANCTSLTSITIPEGVTSIGKDAFYGCSSLTAITIPEGVTSIGSYAFAYCSSLTSITIPESVTSIGYHAFEGCSSLASITIPESVTSIGSYAFWKCSNLTSITIPEGVTSIGSDAFRDCSSLTSITLPEGVTSIGESAFYNCSSLTSITIPEGVTSIGEHAFRNCSSLTAVHISDIAAWCNIEFSNSISNPLTYANNLYLNGELVTELIIPEGVTSIGKYAFSDCRSLTAITLPEGVTSIERYAFSGCSSLTAIVLPKNLKKVYSEAFANCSELIDVYCYAEKVPSAETNAFNGSYPEYVTLHVPASALETYKTTSPWSSFGTIVELGAAITRITLDKTSAALTEGEELTLEITTTPDDADRNLISWSSSNPSVATVDNTGKITAVAPGAAIITATANDGSGASASCEVTVNELILGKCATPTISYADGKVIFACDTEGATVMSTTTVNGAGDRNVLEFALTPTYTITAYATMAHYEDSDVATLTLCWIACTEEHESEETGILTIPAKPVLISTQGGVITVSGLADGTEVTVYSTAGAQLTTAESADGTATLNTDLTAGNIAVVKIGEHSIKVAIK